MTAATESSGGKRWIRRPLETPGDPEPATADRSGGSTQTGAILFSQVVWAHHRWERDRHAKRASDPALERQYLDKLAEFELREGRIEHVYWCTANASAVAMTVSPRRESKKRRWRWNRARPHLNEEDNVIRLHRVSDWVTRDAPRVADLLQECDLLAIRVGEVLRGTSERIAMRCIMGIEEHLLGFVERTGPSPDRKTERELVRAQSEKLAAVEGYYHRAASKAGRIVYVSGMLIGMAAAAVVGLLATLLLLIGEPSWRDVQILVLCYGAGAVGALISAMNRMGRPEAGRFNIDFELGRPLMRRLGVYRPFVGAIVGVALYFLLASGILDVTLAQDEETYYYGFAAFLSGFSERFATVVFGAAERRLGVHKDPAPENP